MTTYAGTATATFTHVTVYFADKMLMLLGNIIRDTGLSMTYFMSIRSTLEGGFKTWLESGHLRTATLEIYKPGTKTLIRRWDLDWDKCSAAEAGFWVDVADVKYHLKKNGVLAEDCGYEFVVDTKPGRPDVPGWMKGSYADTSGLQKYSLGTTISGGSYGSRASYWK